MQNRTAILCLRNTSSAIELSGRGARDRFRTDHLVLTKDVHSQVCYAGMAPRDGNDPPTMGSKPTCSPFASSDYGGPVENRTRTTSLEGSCRRSRRSGLLAPGRGFEPRVSWFRARRLHRVDLPGISSAHAESNREPIAYKAMPRPLRIARVVGSARVELALSRLKVGGLLRFGIEPLVEAAGIEPAISRSQAERDPTSPRL